MIKILSMLIETALWGSLAALAVIAVRPFIKKGSNRIMCLPWLIVMFRLLCPFAIESPISLGSIGEAREKISTVIAGTPDVEDEAVTEAVHKGKTEAAVSGGNVKTSEEKAIPKISKSGSGVSKDLVTTEIRESGSKGIVTVKEDSSRLFPVLIIGTVWLMGTVVMLSIGAVRYIRLHLALREAVPVGTWKIGKRRIPVKISDIPGVPMSFGIIRPCIYMPVSLKDPGKARERQDDLIMMHEAMHIRRLDLLFKLAAYVMLSVHWWNPIAWVCVRLVDRDIELACDETVLRKIGSVGRCAYATALLNFAAEKSGLSLAASFGESNAEKRVANALKYKKSPVWLTAVTLTAAIVLGGCLSMKPAATYSSAKASTSGTKQSDAATGLENVIADISNIRPDPSEEVATLKTGYGVKNDRIITIDGNGNKVIDVDKEEILNVFKESDNYLKGCDVEIDGARDGVVYLSQAVYNSDKGSYGTNTYTFYEVDVATHSLSEVCSYETEGYYSFDLYNRKIYITLRSTSRWEEIVLEKTADGYKEVEEPQEFLTASSEYLFEVENGTSLRRKFDEAGYIIGCKDDSSYMMIFPDGNTSEITGIEGEHTSICDYDKDYVIYSNFAEDEASYKILNLKTGNTVSCPYIAYLDYADGKLYLGEYSESGEGNTVYVYSADTGKRSELYTMEDLAGAGAGLYPGITYFRIIDGRIWTVAAEDGVLKLIEVVDENGKAVFKDHGCSINELTAYKYGTVSSKRASANCKRCGDEILTAYEEVFKLDPKYSANADKINKALAEIDYTGIYADRYTYQHATDDECEQYKDQPKSAISFEVQDVAILSEKYLAVLMTGYLYPAGAVHGGDLREQILFDLETGERVYWYDFYTGTEEEFKTLIASKTEEDAKSYYVVPYFSSFSPDGEEGGNSIYDEVYEYAGIKRNMIELYEDHAILVYPPYEMGPYAAGYIEVTIPYEDLFGRSGL